MKKTKTIIELKNVTKKFGTFTAIEDVSFSVEKGEIIGFVGVNGAGKTTTINAMLGFSVPTRGTISLFGERVVPSNAHLSHRHIGYAAGDMELPLHLTGQQYIDFVMSQFKGDHTDRLEALLKQFSPQLEKKIKTLSRGNKQKIALVAAFMTIPDIVVLDEPTSGLDPIMQDAFLELIRSEQKNGVTIFMSSHYLQEVAEVCTRVLLMKNGRIVEDLSAERLQRASGKLVRVVSKKAVIPPPHAKQATTTDNEHGVTTEFSYDGPIPQLQVWLAGLKSVTDLSVGDRTLEAEFRSLYDEGVEVK